MFRTKKRFNSIIVIILVCVTFFLGPAQNAYAATEETQTPAVTQGQTEEPERLNEVIRLREKNSKTYLLTDGTYEYVGYAEDIHYEDADGNLVEIDNAITDKPTKEGYAYSNTANSWHTYFANSLCEKNAVVLEKEQYTLTFCMVDAQTQSKAVQSSELNESDSVFDEMLANDNRSIVYKDAVKDVDVAYTVKTNILKEDIILRAATAPNIFEFGVIAEGLTILEKEGTIFFVNSEGEDVFNLAPMYMEDANGKYSDKVEYAVEKNEGGYKITITADKEFLNATDTQYPVIVDPSVMISGSSVTFDTCVDQQYPNSNYYLSQNLWTGGLLNTNAMRTFIKFTLPTDIPAACVTSAYLRIKKNANATPTIRAYRVKEEWTPSNVTWNDQPDYVTVPVSGVAYNDSGDWYRIDNVTNFVKYWLSGTYENCGLVLKEPTESNTNQKTRFYSSDAPSPNKPELHIEYDTTSTYNISYNGNGNTGGSAPSSQSVLAGDSIALRTNTGNLTKAGCTLLGWNTNSAGTGTSYSLGQTISPISNLTLYARWSIPAYYTITYNGNGNTDGSAPLSQSVLAGESITLRTNTGNLTKEGRTVTSWNTNSAGTGTNYSLGQTFTPTSNLTLYARWSLPPVRLFYYGSRPTNITTIDNYFEDSGYDAHLYYCMDADDVRDLIDDSVIVNLEGHGFVGGGGIMCTTTTALTAVGSAADYYPLSSYSTSGLPECKFIFFDGCQTARSSQGWGDLDDYAYYTLGVDATLAFAEDTWNDPLGSPSIGAPYYAQQFYDYVLNQGYSIGDAAEAAMNDTYYLKSYWGTDSYRVYGENLLF